MKCTEAEFRAFVASYWVGKFRQVGTWEAWYIREFYERAKARYFAPHVVERAIKALAVETHYTPKAEPLRKLLYHYAAEDAQNAPPPPRRDFGDAIPLDQYREWSGITRALVGGNRAEKAAAIDALEAWGGAATDEWAKAEGQKLYETIRQKPAPVAAAVPAREPGEDVEYDVNEDVDRNLPF